MTEPEELDEELTPRTTTVRWFGPSWGAPVCKPALEIPIPVDQECLFHDARYGDVHLRDGQQGIAVPHGFTGEYSPAHLQCWLRTIAADVTEEVLGKMDQEGRLS